MSSKMKTAMDALWEEITRFDYVDRIVLTFFLAWNLFISVYVLDQHLPVAEQRELVPAIDFMGYLLVFFFLWPLLYLVLVKVVVIGKKRIMEQEQQGVKE